MATNVDLTPPYVEFTLIADEPHTVHVRLTSEGEPVDLAVDYPDLVSRIKIGDAAVLEEDVVVTANVAAVNFPPVQRGSKIYWELRDAAADKTWLTGRINVEKDALPQ